MLDGDRPLRAPGYQVELLEGEALLFHPSRTQLVRLNRSATLIWQLCDGRRTVAELNGLFASAYPEAPSVPDDVQQALRELAQAGALRVAGEGADG